MKISIKRHEITTKNVIELQKKWGTELVDKILEIRKPNQNTTWSHHKEYVISGNNLLIMLSLEFYGNIANLFSYTAILAIILINTEKSQVPTHSTSI